MKAKKLCRGNQKMLKEHDEDIFQDFYRHFQHIYWFSDVFKPTWIYAQ